MNDNEMHSFFSSSDPIPERVDLIDLKNGKSNQFYWMLSVENDVRKLVQNKPSTNYPNLAPYEDNDGDLIDCGDLEDNYEINPTKSGKYMTSFYVPNALHAAIVGPRGMRLRELQENTATLIKVPKPGEVGDVKITGRSERSVASARTQIALILLKKRERMPITHFISIQIASQEITTNFLKFKDDIANGPPTRGIDETIFQKPDKLHLTIVTLTLLDQVEIEKAKNVLSSCRETFKSLCPNRRNSIVLKGLEIMNDDPSDVDVLYGKVQLDCENGDENFQILADEILNCFYKNGLLRKQYESVKLHVTLMNSLFRQKDEYLLQEKSEQKRESFDATYILEKYKDHYFGQTNFEQIELSIRFTTSKTGYYESAAVISL